MIIRLVCFVLLVASCNNAKTPEASTTVSPETRLSSMMSSTAEQCSKGSDCDSTICSIGYCVTLPGATQEWMEATLAARVGELLNAHPELISTLKIEIDKLVKEDQYVQARVAGFLGALARSEFKEILVTLSQDPLKRVSTRAIVALGRMGQIDFFSKVLALTSHRSRALALSAIDSLLSYARLPATQDKAVAALIELLEHDDHQIRRRAVVLLGQSGIKNETVIAGLEALIQRPGDGFLRFDTFEAIVTLAPERFDLTAALLGTVEAQ
ncbi:MAG TPA: hypothetical protein EYN06_00255 [Myxococcales bacterium]|nr:hypothetical protein [Myxococcales bacterium]